MTILLFGATGSAGGSVLRVCLASPVVSEVRAIVRRPTGLADPKLWEIVHADYLDFRAVASAFAGIDACFYCLGISVMQVSGEAEYRKITHDFAMAAARTLQAHSPSAQFQSQRWIHRGRFPARPGPDRKASTSRTASCLIVDPFSGSAAGSPRPTSALN